MTDFYTGSDEKSAKSSKSFEPENENRSFLKQLSDHLVLVSDATITSGIFATIVILIHTQFTLRSIFAIIGISLGYGLAFALNDYYDAPFDQVREDKARDNYFVQHEVTRLTKSLLIITLLLLIVFFGIFGVLGLILLGFSIIILLLYSAEPVRFKTRPGFDILIHAIFVEVYPYVLPIILLQLELITVDYFIIPILFLNSAINQIEQQKRDYSADIQTHNTFVTKYGRRIGSYVLKIFNVGIFITLGIAIYRDAIPSILYPQIIIALPLTLHRFFVSPEKNRSKILYKYSLIITILYWIGIVLYWVIS